MTEVLNQPAAFSDSKTHYKTLDGLRGVAAVTVVIFHIFEAFAGGDHVKQIINHGYLAVDFFFVLSGFVIGYAYDDRWNKMSTVDFFKRRLIRLHPMIILGMVIGAILFYFQASPTFPGIHEVPVWKMIVVTLVGCTLIPVWGSWEIRGWGEMHPLDAPAWTLLYEYIGNIAYALFLRKMSKLILSILVVLSGAAIVYLTVTSPQGDVVGGWSLDHIKIGFTRLGYPFLAGLLLSRIYKPGYIKNAFLWCSLLLLAVLAMPRIGGYNHTWWNGVYESLIILFVFPLIVYMGASEGKDSKPSRLNNFLGQISYPLYITHYPIIYSFFAWLDFQKPTTGESIVGGIVVVIVSMLVAYLSVRFYDVPVRKWLAKRFMARNAT